MVYKMLTKLEVRDACCIVVVHYLKEIQWGTRLKSPLEQASFTALVSDWASYRFYYRRQNYIGFSIAITRRDTPI